MDIKNYSFNCTNYTNSLDVEEDDQCCFSCSHWWDMPCKKSNFPSNAEEKKYRQFLEFIKDFPDEAFDHWYQEYKQTYNLLIDGIKIYLSNPEEYAMPDGTFMWGNVNRPSYVTYQWLKEQLCIIDNQIAFQNWSFHIFQLPSPCKELDTDLKNISCSNFRYINENERPVQNCFMCKNLSNGCSNWNNENHKLSYSDTAKSIMDIMRTYSLKYGIDVVCMYLERFNNYRTFEGKSISKELQKKWADFISLILSDLLEDISYDDVKKIPKRLVSLKKEVTSKKYKKRIDEMIKAYDEFIVIVKKEMEEEKRRRERAARNSYVSSSYSGYSPSTGRGFFDPLITQSGQINWNRAASDYYMAHYVFGFF